jgi:hypothetical protein
MQAKTKRYQCRHIFTAGHRCGSPSLRNEHFCYYHHTTRKAAPKVRPLAPFEFELPIPEDRAAIQQALGEVLHRIATNQIDSRRAGLLLYGLQIAACILPKPERPAKNQPRKPEPQPVEEIIDHPELGLLAPETEFSHRDPNQPKSLAGELLRALRTGKHLDEIIEEDRKLEQGHDQDEDDDEDEETTIPTLQACASSPNLTRINRRLCQNNHRGPAEKNPAPMGRRNPSVKHLYSYRRASIGFSKDAFLAG